MPDDLFKIDDPLADTEEDASIDEPNGVPSLASPSVKRPAPLKVIEADPEFKALTPVQKRQVMYRWVNAMPEMQGLDEHSKQALINRAQSRFPDDAHPNDLYLSPEEIKQKFDITYQYGGDPNSKRTDCSGFTCQIYKRNGVNLDKYRTAQDQWSKAPGQQIGDKNAIQPGDQLFWTGTNGHNDGTASHTGYYLGRGPNGERLFVHNSSTKGGVTVSNLDTYGLQFLGAKRYDYIDKIVKARQGEQVSDAQVRGVQSPKSAGKGSLPFTPSPPEFNVARDIFAPAGSPAQAPSAAPAHPSVDPALVKGQYDRFLNTDNPTANIPMATAVRLSSVPSEQRAADTQLLRMNPVTQAAILQKAHELAANKNWRMNTSMGPATPAEAKRFDLLKGDPKAIAEATAGEANRNILNAAMYYAGLPKAAVQNVLLGLTAGLFPETMSPEQKKNYAKLQRLPHIQQLQYLMAQPVGRELEPNQEAARQSAIDRKVYQGSIPVETLMAAGSGAAIDPLMWGAVGPKLAMRVLEGSAAKVGAKGVAKALASPVAQGAAHTATSAAFAAGSARGLFDPKLWEENPTEAFIQTLFTAAATLGAVHGGLQMRGALKDVGAQNRSYEDAMKRAIHSRTLPDEQMPSDVRSPDANVQGSSVVPTMPGEATETQSGVPTPMPKEVTPNATVQAEQIQEAATPHVPVGETGKTRAGGGGGESQSNELQGAPGKGQEATQVSQPEAVEPEVITGYRGGTGGFGNTEGNGIYVSKDREGAKFFGDVKRVKFKKPQNPIQVDQSELHLLHESEEIEQPIRKSDSQWTTLNKMAYAQAMLEAGGKWNPDIHESAGNILTKLLKARGYDAVEVTGDNGWYVLLDPELAKVPRKSTKVVVQPVEPVSVSPEPVEKPSENVQVPTSGKVVTLQVEGETVTKALTPEQAKAWDDAETQYKQWIENTKSNPNLDPEMKANQLKMLGMKYAAEKRRISGVLTAKEQLAQEKRESTNYQGKSVTVEGKPATVIGNSFGKVKVRLADGTERLVLPEVVAKPSEPPKVEPASPKPAPAKPNAVTAAEKVNAVGLPKPAPISQEVVPGYTHNEQTGKPLAVDSQGFTKPQKAYLGRALEEAKQSLPQERTFEIVKTTRGQYGIRDAKTKEPTKDPTTSSERFATASNKEDAKALLAKITDYYRKEVIKEVRQNNAEQTIHVPGDGRYTVSTKGQAENIQSAIGMKPKEGSPVTATASSPAELPTARESVKAFQEESRTGKAIEALDALEQAAKERLKKRNKGRLSSGIDPLDLADYALIGAAKLGKGIVRFPDWSAEMVRDLGEGVKPHLDALWEYSKRAYDNHVRPSLGENAPIPEENAPKTAKVQPKPRRVKEPEGMEGVTGVAKVVTGRKPQKGITKQELFEMGRDAVVSNRIDPKKVADRTLQSGKPMSDEELAAIGYQLRKIEDARDAIVGEIDKTKDPAALADLDSLLAQYDAESNHLLDAADLTLNKGFHRLGMAAQIALDKTHSLRTLPQRAKAALLGTEAPDGMEEKLKSFMNENSKLQSDLKKVREELAQAYEDKKAAAPKPRSERQRNADIKRLQQYFGKTQGEILEPAKRMGRTAGAVRYTLPDADRAAMAAMRRLAADLAPSATDFPDLMDKIRNAIGSSVPDEQIYRMLSEPYRKFMIEADLNRLKANQYVQQIKRQSEFELKTKAQKALTLVGSTVNTAQRSLQAGMDISAPFIQGRKGLFANPQGWIKSWSPMIESLYRGEDVPMRQMAAIENHPMYSRAKAAGLELTEVGGKFSQQEEMFAGNLIELLHDKLPGTNKTNLVKLYLQGLKNSEAAYTAFLNGIRWDTFVKLAKVDPENPAYLRDVASAINTIYGRGAGRTAKALGSTSLAGNLMFAPRNLMASLEYAGGRPVLFAETAAGRKQAMKIYAAQAASYGTLVVLAWLAGWNVGLDPRSSDFGKVEIGGAKYDLFAKEAQAYRLLTQILYGRVGETGKFTPPKGHTGEFIGNFLVNKAAPSPKLAYEFFEGKLVKKPNGGFDSRPLELRDLAWGLTPFWVSKAAEDGTLSQMPAILLPNIAGEDVEPGTVSQKSVKADWTKPGIFMPKSNAATEARLQRSVNSAGKKR